MKSFVVGEDYGKHREIGSTDKKKLVKQDIFFSGFPPIFRGFLTPLRSVQIWGESRPICRGVCRLKAVLKPKTAQKWAKFVFFSALEIHRQNTPC